MKENNLESIVRNQLKASVGEAVIKTLTSGYQSPFAKLVGDVFESERKNTEKIVKEVFNEVISTDEFKKSLKEEFQRKVAKALIGKMSGQVEKAVNELTKDPTFRPKLILSVNNLITDVKNGNEANTLTRNQVKQLLHAATNNVRDFIQDEDGFIDEYIRGVQ